MNREIEQLKDEITTKEVALEKKHQEHQRMAKEMEQLKVSRFILNYHVLPSFFCLSTGLMLTCLVSVLSKHDGTCFQ